MVLGAPLLPILGYSDRLLGIPEIWRYDGHSLSIYHLHEGQYVTAEASRALPVLTASTLSEFLRRSEHEDQYDILVAFESWLQARQQ